MVSNRNGGDSPPGDEEELHYLLERLLARTSFACEGQDERLDKLLGELRQYLRGRERAPETLKTFQEKLDQELERLDGRGQTEARQLGKVLGRLLEALERSPVLSGSLAGLRRLRKDLGPRGMPQDRLLPWLESFAETVEQTLTDTVGEAPRGRGLFGRLFNREGASPGSAEESGGHDSGKMALDREPPPVGSPDVVQTDPEQRLRIARRVGELMERVMEQVDLPPDTHKRASLIRSRLSDHDDWETLRISLEDTADLVITVISHNQREFENFLQRLDEKLSSLHGHVAEQAEAMAGRRSASAELELSLQEELTELGSHLHASSDIAELRSSVSRHIDHIARTVQAFREQENVREQQLAEQMVTMQEKLVAMETHCEQVRDQLRRERARALTDILTQLPNREAWDERLQFEYNRWQRYGHPVSLAVIDIDHFKRVNDSFGHKAGDRVIHLMAKALRERLRNTDFVARYGGEEFVLLLPETSLEQARLLLDDLRQHVAGMPFHFQGQPVQITFSAGLARFREGAGHDQVFDEADKALYSAKQQGRNRIAGARELNPQ
ncbi:diguanylate cyclase [Marinobacter daqiaonensis]|uniref:diguanylate cyclase n=1 Tax=Marinobacter daqiaonensis TaxID=650891 RepID=A0A1I6JU93_9GAMM|nr:GGDEF domain-containing protein [Marinobacter daqiaonensis]SFR82575.1 diguanylate cyclase [Marinobacter daqiaonensis]